MRNCRRCGGMLREDYGVKKCVKCSRTVHQGA